MIDEHDAAYFEDVEAAEAERAAELEHEELERIRRDQDDEARGR